MKNQEQNKGIWERFREIENKYYPDDNMNYLTEEQVIDIKSFFQSELSRIEAEIKEVLKEYVIGIREGNAFKEDTDNALSVVSKAFSGSLKDKGRK